MCDFVARIIDILFIWQAIYFSVYVKSFTTYNHHVLSWCCIKKILFLGVLLCLCCVPFKFCNEKGHKSMSIKCECHFKVLRFFPACLPACLILSIFFIYLFLWVYEKNFLSFLFLLVGYRFGSENNGLLFVVVAECRTFCYCRLNCFFFVYFSFLPFVRVEDLLLRLVTAGSWQMRKAEMRYLSCYWGWMIFIDFLW